MMLNKANIKPAPKFEGAPPIKRTIDNRYLDNSAVLQFEKHGLLENHPPIEEFPLLRYV
jgi:hypothetical protein